MGYSADISWFANHPYSQNCQVSQIDCLNSPHSEWTNVVYDLTYNTVHCTDGDVLLAAIDTERGVLGICVNGIYSTVCRDTSSDLNQLAEVSCRLLGYDGRWGYIISVMLHLYVGYRYNDDRYITSTVPVISYFDCPIASTLTNCTFSFEDQLCNDHDDDAEIHCESELLSAIYHHKPEICSI